MSDELDRVAAIHSRFATSRAELLRRDLSEQLLAGYERDPWGPHPEALERILRFLERRPPSERVCAYCEAPGERWRLVRPPARRGDGYRIVDRRTFESETATRTACLRRELFDVFGWGADPGDDAADGPTVPVEEPVLLGYADRMSVAPGERVTFMVSAEGVERFTTELHRMRRGDERPEGSDASSERVPCDWEGEHAGVRQVTRVGSHVQVDDAAGELAGDGGFAVAAFVYPTLCKDGLQAIVSYADLEAGRGYVLGLDDEARLGLWIGLGGREAVTRLPSPLLLGVWYGVAASFDPGSGRATVVARPCPTRANSRLSPIVIADGVESVEDRIDGTMAVAEGRTLLFGASAPDRPGATGHFNGKIEDPALWAEPQPLAVLAATISDASDRPAAPYRWSFGTSSAERSAASLVAPCAGRPELAGALVNLPVRGMTGRHWTSDDEHYVLRPESYGALHFHDDALVDSEWTPTLEATVPSALSSGVYALRVAATDGSCEALLPFVVRPPRGRRSGARIALLLPTATYLAYANERTARGYAPVIEHGNAFLEQHYDLGLSTYARHSDGHGVCYTSARRPILSATPSFRHHLGPFWLRGDLCIVDWLTAREYAFDVVTDHDLHADGVELLAGYSGVITGGHPEYASSEMLDAIEDYLDGGGNFAYLGGNGFYWVVSFHPDLPHVMEIRRGESGSRSWQSRPGELHHATSGERGGLWRMRGRPPQKIFGIGFASQGIGPGGHYRRGPGVAADEDGWLLDGVPDVFGDAALKYGGAVGSEVDRLEPELGSPPDAVVLASSEGLGDEYQFVVDEVYATAPGQGGSEHPDVRADVVFFRTRGGGSVFATGSIAYTLGLSANAYDNALARLTANVVEHWLEG